MKTIEEMRQEVFAWTKQSYAEKLFAGTSGNLSMYDPDSGIMTITPTSIPYETILPEDMVAMRLDGEVVDGHYAPSSEWRLHAEIYKAFPEAGAVVHSHSPYATAFAVAHQSIPVILIEMVPFLGGDVPLAEFAVPGTDAVGLNAVAAMQERPACLMANHGVVAFGTDLKQAHIRAVYVEDAAKICYYAKGIGEVHVMSDEAIRAMKGE